jgi:hypothetical protein
MTFRRIDVLKELKRLAAGKPTNISPDRIAGFAVELLKARTAGPVPTRAHNDGLRFLDQLYALPDTRRPQV